MDTLSGAGVGGGVDAAGEVEAAVGLRAEGSRELPWEMNPKPPHLRLSPQIGVPPIIRSHK
jgi:hypothetical protein